MALLLFGLQPGYRPSDEFVAEAHKAIERHAIVVAVRYVPARLVGFVAGWKGRRSFGLRNTDTAHLLPAPLPSHLLETRTGGYGLGKEGLGLVQHLPAPSWDVLSADEGMVLAAAFQMSNLGIKFRVSGWDHVHWIRELSCRSSVF